MDTPDALPATHPTIGFAMVGEYPLNSRLRAEALARDGKTTDDGGYVTDELIADAKDRVEREGAEAARVKAEQDAAHPPVSVKDPKATLVEVAKAEGLDVDPAAPKAAIVETIETARAADPAPAQ